MLNQDQTEPKTKEYEPKHYKPRSSIIELEIPGKICKAIGDFSVKLKQESDVKLSTTEIVANILKEVFADPQKSKPIFDGIEQTCVRISQKQKELTREIGELRGNSKAKKNATEKTLAPVNESPVSPASHPQQSAS